ncbi:peptidyl-tRNA hydrolase family protein [Actinidia rufa]|uniref:Peptidyl-tRNA hydrolase family protein n=1 Tax=Actinidia rufa TaxID=165716 RepID=A0A7J0EKG6_9ERIC|nr:peptidyl-tRNA hydrolase family protein [Actinidia rufa]
MLYAVSGPTPCISYRRSLNFHQRRLAPTRFRVSSSLPEPNGVKAEYTPWLIVGLGNPGIKYHGTRHNVGFEMIDHISQVEGVQLNTIQSKALIGIGSIGEVPILLAKPQAYMNFSVGNRSELKSFMLRICNSTRNSLFYLNPCSTLVGPLAAYYQVPLRHILLVYDEMNLPNGVLKLQRKAGHGYHNGVKSVIGHLDGCREFPRLCIGIGNPPGSMDMKAYLLQKFSLLEREQVDAALQQGLDAVRNLVLHGFNNSTTRFNLEQKYKYHKV